MVSILLLHSIAYMIIRYSLFLFTFLAFSFVFYYFRFYLVLFVLHHILSIKCLLFVSFCFCLLFSISILLYFFYYFLVLLLSSFFYSCLLLFSIIFISHTCYYLVLTFYSFIILFYIHSSPYPTKISHRNTLSSTTMQTTIQMPSIIPHTTHTNQQS